MDEMNGNGGAADQSQQNQTIPQDDIEVRHLFIY